MNISEKDMIVVLNWALGGIEEFGSKEATDKLKEICQKLTKSPSKELQNMIREFEDLGECL